MKKIKEKIIKELIQIEAIQFGEFKLKSGIISPIYIDLRKIISKPVLLKDIAEAMFQLSKPIDYEIIAGIPYTALPIATAFSLHANTPMVYSRKEAKSYGTKRLIEGIWKKGQKLLVIDDLITNGDSKFEVFDKFESAGLVVKDVIVLIDREQGGKDKLAGKGYQLHSLISVFEVLDYLLEHNLIDQDKYNSLHSFLSSNRT